MKAIRIAEFGGPEVMRPEDVSLPVPDSGQVLIDVKAAGVNPVETYIRAGRYGDRQMPFTPGLDAAGVVVAVGPDVRTVSVGQRVFTSGSLSGTYAQQCLCAVSQVHALPENTTFAQGATLGVPYGTAWRALYQRACAAAGQTVLVHGGSGGVGLAAIQFAKAGKMRIIATAGTEQGRQLLSEQGADLALDHHDPGHFDAAMEFTDGKGLDMLLEMLANVNLGQDLKVMAHRGQIVVIGSRGPVEIDPRDCMAREITITGMMLARATENEQIRIYAAIEAGLVDGTLRPVVGQQLPLSEAPKAHRMIMESAHHGNIVLIP